MSLIKLIQEEIQPIWAQDTRRPSDIMLALMSELGELADEVDAHYGENKYVQPGEGIIPEAVDLMIGLVYLINWVDSNVSEDELKQIAVTKINKWKAKLEHATKR